LTFLDGINAIYVVGVWPGGSSGHTDELTDGEIHGSERLRALLQVLEVDHVLSVDWQARKISSWDATPDEIVILAGRSDVPLNAELVLEASHLSYEEGMRRLHEFIDEPRT
jgi:hypothetical protein